jgi:hypothetical protein
MSPTQQETHAQEMAEVESLTAEGAALLTRISAALQEAAGPDLVRFVEIRKRLTVVISDAGRRGFPLSPGSLVARKTRAEFDRTLAVLIDPIKKLLG